MNKPKSRLELIRERWRKLQGDKARKLVKELNDDNDFTKDDPLLDLLRQCFQKKAQVEAANLRL